MVGLKHLAAGVLVAGSLLAGAGGMLVRADDEAPPGPKVTMSPPLKTEVPPPPKTVKVTPRLNYTPAGGEPARPGWEHQTVDKPGSRQELDLLLAARGKSGWEFAGLVRWPSVHDGIPAAPQAPYEVLVFKRPVPAPVVVTAPAPTPSSLPQPSNKLVADGQLKSFQVRNVPAAGLAEQLSALIQPPTRVISDSATNTLLVTAPPATLDAIRNLLTVLDRPVVSPPLPMLPPPATPAAPKLVGGFTAIPLKHATATDVARTVRELFTPPSPPAGANLAQPFVVSADDRRNVVLFRIGGGFGQPTERQVRELVAELDVPTK